MPNYGGYSVAIPNKTRLVWKITTLKTYKIKKKFPVVLTYFSPPKFPETGEGSL